MAVDAGPFSESLVEKALATLNLMNDARMSCCFGLNPFFDFNLPFMKSLKVVY
jgi:hypothetical protein